MLSGLTCHPVLEGSLNGKIPEEAKALSLLAPAAPVTSLMSGGGLLPIPSPATLQNRGLPLANLGVLKSSLDTSVAALNAIASQPPLMGNVDPSKIDEIRRTVYVGNLNSQSTTAEQLLKFFKQVGDVKFVRMAGDETQPTRFAFVEFADQESVARALTFNGVMFGDRPLKINHSNNAIVKPPELTPQAAAKELEDVMKKVREAQSTIAAAIEPENKNSSSGSRRSRRSRSRSRSPSHSRRKRSRSRHRGRPSQRSRQKVNDSHGSHRRRSRSREKKHSRSRSHSRDRRKDKDSKVRKDDDWEEKRPRDKKGRTSPKGYSGSRRSCSISRGHKKRSRSRSRSPKRRARSPSPSKRGKKDRKRDKGRDISRERTESSTSRRKSRDYEHKAKPLLMERGYEQADHEYDSDMDGSGSVGTDDRSPQVHLNGSYGSTYAEEDDLSAAE
ncbi:splicing regulatory glutamine/lysine-rich protein 1 isoform X4 [Labeo rohita]|uniref:splicing regulatory glutamine/lysine-rich protein 1 isoform X4 n=1 Tax=Labeo rohita TaxID=84645 RepID=UPI0021E31569|nr:splicing regulatory glutamine/lysine-rich protein 1 isoform X4 [Labeo rohita]XP_050965072.1 splicing regulatory glutamine/lysine-rich protein 1 isoform X4 [Labeo rohita]XP_050965073.1 splicing regulatory glutamine/lysine-rich protein 1 isoform X4 [Labeo rohita]